MKKYFSPEMDLFDLKGTDAIMASVPGGWVEDDFTENETPLVPFA